MIGIYDIRLCRAFQIITKTHHGLPNTEPEMVCRVLYKHSVHYRHTYRVPLTPSFMELRIPKLITWRIILDNLIQSLYLKY